MDSCQYRRGFSKSQFSLHKILRIISSYPSKENESSSIPQINDFQETKGLAFDLNTELFPWPDESDSFSASSTTAAGGGGGKGLSHDTADGEFRRDFAAQSSSEGECDPNTIQAAEKESEAEIHQSVGENVNEEEFTDGGIKSAAAVENDDEGKRKSDCFSLLIAAAEMINCDSIDQEEKLSFQSANEHSKSPPPAVDVLTAARSKRRRSKVIPSRYRDSVIEPWKRRPRTGGFHKTR